MRQLGDLLVWCVVVAVVAGAIYFTPVIIQQVSNPGSLTFAPEIQRSTGPASLSFNQEMP